MTRISTTTPVCPHCGHRAKNYRKQPHNYIQAQNWADEMLKTHEQLPCKNCGRLTVWKRKAKA